jgi:probable HAF family extracellular repeat protein
MQSRWTLTGILALALAASDPSTVLHAAGPTVTIEDLGPAGFVTRARGVNADGLVAGFGLDGTADFGFTQMAAPVFVPLPSGATSLDALALNLLGVATGRYYAADGFSHPFRYDTVANTFADVPLLAGANQGTAQAINASGVVAGFTVVGGKTHGFRQSPGAAVEDMGDLGGGFSSGYGINAAGVVVGTSRDTSNVSTAVRYDGALHPMTSLGGVVSVAQAINDAGLAVGYSTTATNQLRAAAWTSDTTVANLGTLGGAWSQATAVSPNGAIVGSSQVPTGESHACLWKGGALTDLNDLIDPVSGWVLDVAYGVNDKGVIVGDGHLNGDVRAFRLTITDEAGADVTVPVVSAVSASPNSLWPPKHQMVDVTVGVNASDDSGVSPTCQLAGISSSDPDNGIGDGDTAGDAVITGPLTAKLRAERSGPHDRVYTLSVQCTDEAGNIATATTTVRVPKNGK